MSKNYLMWEIPCQCTGTKESDKFNINGVFYGWINIDRRWAIVKWEDEEDPDLCKADLLLIEETRMVLIEG